MITDKIGGIKSAPYQNRSAYRKLKERIPDNSGIFFFPSSPHAFGGDPGRFQRTGSPITTFEDDEELVIVYSLINS